MTQVTKPTWFPFIPVVRKSVRIKGFIRIALDRLTSACDRYCQRRHLAELNAHQLADIGLTQRDVERECSKPFWQV